jgi:CSLREA domain-containing protein
MIQTLREESILDASRRIAKVVFELTLFGVLFTSLLASPALASTFTANSTGDGFDASAGDGMCVTGSGECTLRAAIEEANFKSDLDTIKFNIPGGGVHTIAPTSALPNIVNPIIIDGYSQGSSTSVTSDDAKPNTLAVGNNAVLKIELSGASAGSGVDGLWISGANSTVKGLVINRWSRYGVYISDVDEAEATGNQVQGNYIGTKANGAQDLGNSVDGVRIQGAPNNIIGGTTAEARNVISGNDQAGVVIVNSGATGNQVQGNYIGTDKKGTADLGNTNDGVQTRDGASKNTIGGTVAGARNIISGNNNGVSITNFSAGATGNQVQGNYIGTDSNGTADLGNTYDGVTIVNTAINNIIGGTKAGARNVISGNDSGVTIWRTGATGNQVQGNYVGTNAAGTKLLGGATAGVEIVSAPNNTIGGTVAGARNVISGSSNNVAIHSTGATGNQVQGNYVGTNAVGTKLLGNASVIGVGIYDAPNNTIGGTVAGARNVISDNDYGIYVHGSGGKGNKLEGNVIFGNSGTGVSVFSAGATGNRIHDNSIYSNGGLGINLATDGVTSNDPKDLDTGSNGLQNYPRLTSAPTGNKTSIQGTLNSTPGRTFTIQFFSSPQKDPSGNGEGKKFIGELTGPQSVTPNANGNVSFTFIVTAPSLVVPLGQVVSATATDDTTGDTSEFSAAKATCGGSPSTC